MKILVHAKTSSKNPRITKLDDTHFVVAVKEPPREGKANRAIARVLADYFDIAPSRVLLVSGRASKQKLFEITMIGRG